MNYAFLWALISACLLTPLLSARAQVTLADLNRVGVLYSLVDPAKLATLRPRGAVARIDKAMVQLAEADDPAATVAAVIARLGWTGSDKGRLLSFALLDNLNRLQRLGCLTPENLDLLRRGRAPIVTLGDYRGEVAELDHIVPVAHAEDLSNVIANHRYVPRTMNRAKGDQMGPDEIEHERQLRAAGW